MRRPLGQAFLLGIVVGLAVALLRRATRPAATPTGPPTLDRIGPPTSGPEVVPDGGSTGDDRTGHPGTTAPAGGEDGATGRAVPHPGGSHDEGDHPELRWVRPADGGCPDGYPVKAKEASGIFHVPGGASYARTRPDRCYATPEGATADGFRPAKH